MAAQNFKVKNGLTVGTYNIIDANGNLTVPGNITVTGTVSPASGGTYATQAYVTSAISGKADTSSLATVATSGSYTDLTNKPSIPTATSALTNDSGFITSSALTGYATESYVTTAISNLVDSAPTTLDTLNELAAALGDDANFATTVTNAIGLKLSTSDFNSTFDTRLGTKTTSNLAEGTNLYYTDARVGSYLTNNSYATQSYVTSAISGKVDISSLSASATTDTTNASNISSGTLSAARLPAFTGDATSSSGTSSLTLATVNSNIGTFGSSTAVPVITVNAKGLITAVSTESISGSLTFTGDVTGSGTTGSSTTLTLANSGVTAGTYTKITVDAKGRATTATNATTSDISEGSNQYFTTARARESVSGGTGISYDNSTGVISTSAIPNSSLANSSITVTAGTGLSGGGSVSLGGTVTLSNAGVTSVSGTANQITASASTGGITLSLPSSITTPGDLTATGNLAGVNGTFSGNMQIDGNLTVNGTTVTINTTNLSLEDNMIYLNDGSAVANPDLGIAGNYNDGTYRHTGVFRDASDGKWKFFHQYTPEPDASAFIDTTHASFALAPVAASSFEGNGSALTSLTAGNLTGTIPSSVLGNSSVNIGTTGVALNRASANLALTGISSVTLPGSSSGSVQLVPVAAAGTGTVLTIPATTGTIITTGDTGTVTNTMLAGSISTSKITGLAASATTDTTNASNITSGTLPNARLSSIPNSALANSSITINGSAIALGGSVSNLALTTGNLSQFASTTSAQLLGIISDETGSGALVFANTPTLVTPNIGAATGTSLTTTGGGILARAAATQDGVEIRGRAGGTGNWEVIITPTTLSADRTLTLPNVSGTVITTGDTGTVTNTMLANSSITINGSAVALGGSATISGATDIAETARTISSNYTIASTKNGMSVGPITIASGVTVTVSSGSRWVVI